MAGCGPHVLAAQSAFLSCPCDAPMELIWPNRECLPAYVNALERGWSPDNLRGAAAAREELDQIERDADGYLALQVDREARGGDVTLPDGSKAKRLPGYRRWMWDGEFCGLIGFRWQAGTSELPPTVLGHIGYAVVPWKRNRGIATSALKLQLADCRAEGLSYVELTTDADNLPSQKVITANGGVVVEAFRKAAAYGGAESLRYRIMLA